MGFWVQVSEPTLPHWQKPELGGNGLRTLARLESSELALGTGSQPELHPGTSHGLLWTSVSQSVKGGIVLRLLRALHLMEVFWSRGYNP